MLVLSRKRGEQILIGDDIVVTVVECTGNRIKVGIEAPRYVRVVRSELVSEDQEEPASCDIRPLLCDTADSHFQTTLLVGHPR